MFCESTRCLCAAITANPPPLRLSTPCPHSQAHSTGFQFSALSLASIKCTANATSTTMTGVQMVKASYPGNSTTSNASNIATAHRNRAIHFRRRSYRWSGFTAWRPLVLACDRNSLILSEIRRSLCDANHENSLWNYSNFATGRFPWRRMSRLACTGRLLELTILL